MGFVDFHLGYLFNICYCQVKFKFFYFIEIREKNIFRISLLIIKSLIILYPIKNEKGFFNLTYRQRSSYLAFIEHLSQFYLCLLTIRPWIHFLIDRKEENLFFSSFLLIFYLIVKVNFL